MPMMGADGGFEASEPTKAVLEKSNTPPSLATMRYPLPYATSPFTGRFK